MVGGKRRRYYNYGDDYNLWNLQALSRAELGKCARVAIGFRVLDTIVHLLSKSLCNRNRTIGNGSIIIYE